MLMRHFRVAWVLLSILAALCLAAPTYAQAVIVDVVVNPATTNTTVSSSFTVIVQAVAGAQPVDSVAVTLSFDPALLSATSAAGNMPIPLVGPTISSGSITYEGGALPTPISGTFNIMTVQFTALGASAGTPLTLSGVQALVGGSTVLRSTTGGTVVITGPTNTPTHTPTNTPIPPPTNTPTHTNTPAPPTSTPTNTPIPPPTNTPTNTPIPPPTDTPTPTITPGGPTLTPTNTPTNTPIPPPTNTPTNTPVAPPTNTPVPGATNTPVPPPTNTPMPGSTNTPGPAAPTPTPGPAIAPLCPDFNGSTNALVRAFIPPGTATLPDRPVNIYCRILTVPAEISVPNEQVLAAVDVFALSVDGRVSVTVFNNPMRVCLRGFGALLFSDANGAPRILRQNASFFAGDYTCGDIPNAGSVVLVARAGLQPPTPTPVSVGPIPGGTTHVVQRGENLFRIALRYGVPLQTLAAVNNISNPALIFAGQVLIIPGTGALPPVPTPVATATPLPTATRPAASGTPTPVIVTATPRPTSTPVAQVTHTVQRGENLFRIALRYGQDYRVVAAANGITNPRLIYPGQVLIIPPRSQ